jgi:hypothetical protein
MAILVDDPTVKGKALFAGGTAHYTHDDAGDSKDGGGNYSHKALEFSANEAQQISDWLLYVSSLLNGAATAADLVGFYGATAIAQPASANQAALAAQSQNTTVDSTGGTPSVTYALVAAGGSYTEGNLNDNFATVAARLAEIKTDVANCETLLTAIRNALVPTTGTGLIKGSA